MRYFGCLSLSFFVLFAICSASIVYTVSGFSAGAFMAVQLHVAYSTSVNGVGVISGGPYYCTMGSLSRTQTACTANAYLIDLVPLVSYANLQASLNQIDPVKNLFQSKVFIYSAKQDTRIFPAVAETVTDFYLNFVNSSNIQAVFTNNGVHTFPTISNGNPCWFYGLPYIGACNYDGAGSILSHLYSINEERSQFNNSNLFFFDQTLYANTWKAGLSTRGWVYVPYACRQNPGGCQLHVVLHGCGENFEFIRETFIKESGYGEWAENNYLIILFPQTVNGAINTGGCWDFMGFTGKDFALKSGKQMAAINSMAQNYVSLVQELNS